MRQGRNIAAAERNGGYTWLENRFIETVLLTFSGTDTRIYLYLVRNIPYGYESEPLTPSWLSQSKIGETLNLSRESVNRGTKRLEGNGAIKTRREPGYSNRYLLLGKVNLGKARRLGLVKEDRGFTWIANTCIDKFLLKLSGTEIKVYMYLARRTDQKSKNQITWTGLSAAKIAKALNLDRSTVNEARCKLEKVGLIEKIPKPGYANRYRLLETCEENTTGGVKETRQGCNGNPTPPVTEIRQVNGAKRYEIRAGGSPKSTLKKREKNIIKRRGECVLLGTVVKEILNRLRNDT
jgi:DNA-binding MarR family transcriptional regulator